LFVLSNEAVFEVLAKWPLFPKNLVRLNIPFPVNAPLNASATNESAVPPVNVTIVAKVPPEPD